MVNLAPTRGNEFMKSYYYHYIDDKWHMCNTDVLETIAHIISDSRLVRISWKFSTRIIDNTNVKTKQKAVGKKSLPLFAKSLEFGFCYEASRFGHFTLWVERDDLVSTSVCGRKMKCGKPYGKVFLSMH